MMKKIFTKRSALIALAVFLILQAFRIDKSTKPADPAKDFILLNQPGEELGNLLKNSCYDCHSNQASYPWYTNIAPVSWWIKHHINEGSEHLNFSEWSTYSSRKADHKLKECVEMLEESEMPLSSYVLMHGDAALSAEQSKQLTDYLSSLRTFESEKPKD
jgi:hypothetical protein